MFSIRSEILFNKPLKVLLSTNVLILISGYMFIPIYAIFVEQIGGNLMDAGFAAGIFAVSATIVTFFAGKLSDRKRYSKYILLYGYLLIGFGFFSLQYITTIKMLFIIQVIIGMGEAVYSPAFDKLYSQHVNKKSAGKQWGAWESLSYFSHAVGSCVGAIIAYYFSFNVLFIVMAALCFISGFYLYFFVPKNFFKE